MQSRVWDQTKYGNFRDKINLYRGWIDDAYAEPDRDESIGKWQRVLGGCFAAGEAKAAARVSESVTRSDAIVAKGHLQDLVDRVKTAGREALPIRITRLPYVQRPKWRAGAQMYQVKVFAELLTPQGNSIRSLMSLEPLKKGPGIRFTASNHVGLPFGNNYKIEWRITNTDKAAYHADALRGEFYRSDVGNSRSEGPSYRGVHFAEAFLIGRHDNRLYGTSDPFYVVIE